MRVCVRVAFDGGTNYSQVLPRLDGNLIRQLQLWNSTPKTAIAHTTQCARALPRSCSPLTGSSGRLPWLVSVGCWQKRASGHNPSQ